MSSSLCLFINLFIYLYVYLPYVRTYICLSTHCMYVQVCVYVCRCIYVYIYVICIYVCMYMYLCENVTMAVYNGYACHPSFIYIILGVGMWDTVDGHRGERGYGRGRECVCKRRGNKGGRDRGDNG